MSFLMDELKKAERPPRVLAGGGRETPALASGPAAEPVVSASAGRHRLTAGLALGVLLLAGAGAAYYWRPAAPAPVAAAPEPPPLQRAQTALQHGDYAGARAAYRQALAASPTSPESLRGLAIASLRLGQLAEAEESFLRALQLDPQDLQAQDGLIAMQGQGVGAQQAEVRLQALLAAHPRLAFLHYGLGNLYASQNRWVEAQQAFLQAYRAEPDNPDFLFNLAVSLDYLEQPQAARQLYRLSLEAAERRGARFDRRQAVARLDALVARQRPQ